MFLLNTNNIINIGVANMNVILCVVFMLLYVCVYKLLDSIPNKDYKEQVLWLLYSWCLFIVLLHILKYV